MVEQKNRCEWCLGAPEYIDYHDKEWGVPVHDDRKHFEFLTLEGAQAGLSWITILRRREGYRKAFANFDPGVVASFEPSLVEELLQDPGIIRNFGNFDKYIWSFVGEKPIVNTWKTMSEIPATSKESDALSKDLKNRGFKFVGSTIIYAHMQACGLINDHRIDCFRYREFT
jgi:DNA-3-methyladenine glycosylase I